MRLLSMFILSASATLLPALASADPVQAPAAATAMSVSASPGAQTSATTPTQGAPSPPTTVMQTGPESVVVKADAVDLDQIVCLNAPPPVGSRLGGGRVCHSQREWNRIRNEAQDATRHLERMPYAGR